MELSSSSGRGFVSITGEMANEIGQIVPCHGVNSLGYCLGESNFKSYLEMEFC